MKYVVEVASCGMIIPSFMTVDIGIHAILKFCLSSFRGCKVALLMGWIYEVCH
jgi:hypothetical protein